MRYKVQAFSKTFGWVDYSFFWKINSLSDAVKVKKDLEDGCEMHGLSRQFRIKLFTSEKC